MVQILMAYITKMILNASTLLKKCDNALQKSLQARLLNLLSCSLYSKSNLTMPMSEGIV